MKKSIKKHFSLLVLGVFAIGTLAVLSPQHFAMASIDASLVNCNPGPNGAGGTQCGNLGAACSKYVGEVIRAGVCANTRNLILADQCICDVPAQTATTTTDNNEAVASSNLF